MSSPDKVLLEVNKHIRKRSSVHSDIDNEIDDDGELLESYKRRSVTSPHAASSEGGVIEGERGYAGAFGGGSPSSGVESKKDRSDTRSSFLASEDEIEDAAGAPSGGTLCESDLKMLEEGRDSVGTQLEISYSDSNRSTIVITKNSDDIIRDARGRKRSSDIGEVSHPPVYFE